MSYTIQNGPSTPEGNKDTYLLARLSNIGISNELMYWTANTWSVPDGLERLCGNNKCNNLAKQFRSQCRFEKHCSKICQRKKWKEHKPKCIPCLATPKHEIFPVELEDPHHPRSVERLNAHKIPKYADAPACQVLRILTQQDVEQNYRIGCFGHSRYAKTAILLATGPDLVTLHEVVRNSSANSMGLKSKERFDGMVDVVHERLPKEEKYALIRAWMKPDSNTRILSISSNEELSLIAPDTVTVIDLDVSTKHRLAMVRQRMAGYTGQAGRAVNLTPYMANNPVPYKDNDVSMSENMVRHFPDVSRWRPGFWTALDQLVNCKDQDRRCAEHAANADETAAAVGVGLE